MKSKFINIFIFIFIFLVFSLVGCVGEKGPQGPQGEQGIQGEQGQPGKDGHSPKITIGENGNWYIDGVDTGVIAEAQKGENGESGQDGTSLLTGYTEPSTELGKDGDAYINLDNWNFYVKSNDVWNYEGNIKGSSEDAHNGTEDLEFYPINDTECAVAVGKAKLLKEIVIPSKYKNYTVTTIYGLANDGGFQNCSVLKKITLPDTVTSIGSFAFYNCSSLTSIEIPDSVTSIGVNAFCNCSSLTSIEIPDSVTSIGVNAFSYCSSLTIYCEASSKPSEWSNDWNASNRPVCWGISKDDIITTNGLQYIIQDNEAIVTRYVGNDANVKIPSTIEKDGVTYNVTSIGSYAFYKCSSLTSIEIPDSVTSIGVNAFCNCSSLTSIIIPDSVTSIGSYAFYKCSSLTSIEIPDSGTSIGDSAFSYCSSLTSIIIPDSVTSIGVQAFYKCSSLTIYCEASSKPSEWNNDWNYSNRPVYWGISKDDIITTNGLQYIIQDNEAIVTRYVGNDANVKIPSTIEKDGVTYNVTSIGVQAFSYCSSLTSIIIPDSVTSIGVNAIYNCSSLTSIIIPDSVTSIGSYAIYNCSSLTIYCETSSKPSEWNNNWNASNRPVYWAGQWEYDANGYPVQLSQNNNM